MTWAAQLTIHNDTTYNITVNHNSQGDLTTISPGGSWTNTTSDPNNTNALRFWVTPNVWYMQGSVAYGPQAGVYMDRGWQAPADQSIRLVGVANGVTFTQTTNGGKTVLAWNEFESGGTIDMTFTKV